MFWLLHFSHPRVETESALNTRKLCPQMQHTNWEIQVLLELSSDRREKKWRSFSFPNQTLASPPLPLSSLHRETLLVLSAANNLSIRELFSLNFSVVNGNQWWLSWNSSSSLAFFSHCYATNYTLYSGIYTGSIYSIHRENSGRLEVWSSEANDCRWKIWF